MREALKYQGIALSMEHCATGDDALKALVAMQKAPDLILLDNNLPPGAGLSY